MNNKFGVEIEINSFDNRDFFKNPLKRGELPVGLEDVANILSNFGTDAIVQPWGYNHNNSKWICKPDASCGIEVCSPVFEQNNFKELISVINLFASNDKIKIDDRCSFHVHVDIGTIEDFYNSNLLSSILAWWIKCEHVFMDFAVRHRKHNKYCRFIGKTELFDHDEKVSAFRAISKLSDKYLTLNTYHLFNKRRWTLEFRLGEGTKDEVFVKNWISIILKFIDRCGKTSPPDTYKWIHHHEVFDFLDFSEKEIDLKIWFLKRLLLNCDKKTPIGQFSHAQYVKILDKI
jgi:hypothetical protein